MKFSVFGKLYLAIRRSGSNGYDLWSMAHNSRDFDGLTRLCRFVAETDGLVAEYNGRWYAEEKQR